MGLPSLRIAVITKCYQEQIMLPVWIKHYSRLVGEENLFILDHGSSPPVQVQNNIYVERISRQEYLDESETVRIISEWQQKLLQTYDWVIFVDTDEFILPRPSRWNSLGEYLSQCSAQICRCVGVEVIDPMIKPPVDWSKSILRQRSNGVITSWSCKPSVSSVPTIWDPGFHRCQNSHSFEHDLWLFHLKYADQNHLLEHSEAMRRVPRHPEDIENGLGISHLLSDDDILKRLNQYRRRVKEGSLDDYLATQPDPNEADSECLAIPEEFLDCL
ncbi:unnamed protein product [Commensalibacter communis]|uniref:glycosyltransferase family 2 protein n=1 Tax=Commensalibacter communis TaxID=2972786 RepID=UPI0022FFA3D8|nr:glycosyltransferase family 2 protein [Commensalibacter communis]CAI3945319.1 unnamed protein product [Commensalibacter communis]CAI3946594.1 unnamed protein product [Commensalibacter communis]